MKSPSLFVALVSVLACGMLSLVLPASAQELNLGPIIDPGIAGNAAAQRQIAEQEYKRATGRDPRSVTGRKSPSTSGSTSTARTVRGKSGSTLYRVDPAARSRRVAAWKNKLRAVDDKGMAQFERTPAGRDLFAVMGHQLRRYGLRTDDVADTLTVYLVTAWYGVRGSDQDPPRAIVVATRNQMRTSLLANPTFAAASNATKQEVGEALLLQTIEDSNNVAIGKKNPKQMAQVKSLIRQNALKVLHLDLTKLKLTSQGLRL